MRCHRCVELHTEVGQWRDAHKAWEETAQQYAKNAEYYRTTLLALQAQVHAGLRELVSGAITESVGRGYQMLADALEKWGIVDGLGVHAHDCPKDPCRCSGPKEEL